MRTVTQRVQHASVTIDGQLKSKIGKGLLVLVGIEDKDTQEDIEWLAKKITNLRIFDDEKIMVVSQFTLHASTKKGNRPSYLKASKPDIAIPMYKAFCEEVGLQLGKPVQTGTFGADMKIVLMEKEIEQWSYVNLDEVIDVSDIQGDMTIILKDANGASINGEIINLSVEAME